MKEQKLIAITGPSASGKSSLAINLAKELNGEIISVDSRQIYKELNIGSAKPTEEEKQGILHHLTDIVDINQDYTVANFADDAKSKIQEIKSRGKSVILAGGTGLYFRVLLQDFDLPRVAPDESLRNELNAKTTQELYDMLCYLDPDMAKQIHFNNKVKIVRALEVCKILGIPMSKARKKKESPYNILWIGLNSSNREYLYSRANKRVDNMLEQGLEAEARTLFNKYPDNKILLNTIGYQELYPYFNGEITLTNAAEKLKQNTRRYIKRQLSWFNANKEIIWFDIEKQSQKEITETVLKKYKNL